MHESYALGKLKCIYICVQSLDVNICAHTHKYILWKTKENMSAYLSHSIFFLNALRTLLDGSCLSPFFFPRRIILIIKRGHMTSTKARVYTDGLVPLFGWWTRQGKDVCLPILFFLWWYSNQCPLNPPDLIHLPLQVLTSLLWITDNLICSRHIFLSFLPPYLIGKCYRSSAVIHPMTAPGSLPLASHSHSQ